MPVVSEGASREGALSRQGSGMSWYCCSVIFTRGEALAAGTVSVRECYLLVEAEDGEHAYSKCLQIGPAAADKISGIGAEGWSFKGLSDIIPIVEAPADGSEVLWSESELSPPAVESWVRGRPDLRAFKQAEQPHPKTGWYVAEIVLTEVHDTGTHGDDLLVWTNSHLVKSTNPEDAYDASIGLGKKYAAEIGGHRCDGDTAHWSFKGLRDLMPTLEPPANGAALWFEDFLVSESELPELLPPKDDLSVFEPGRLRPS